jgi:lysozyme family protein
MVTIYDWALQCVLHHEGGLVDDPDDPGGITNHGISLRFLRWTGDLDGNGLLDGDYDGDGDIDADDIRAISADQVSDTYRLYFWEPNRLDAVRSELVAVKIFDMAVNMGGKQAWKLVQEALNQLGATLTVDGSVGPKTLAEVDKCLREDYILVTVIRDRQHKFYERLIANRPQLAKFRTGWRRRAAF